MYSVLHCTAVQLRPVIGHGIIDVWGGSDPPEQRRADVNMRQVAGPRPERKRFEVYTRDGVSQVWDHVEEASVFMTSGSEDAAQGLADRLNENACAICGEQCEEAHSQTRLGRVCERCTDEYIDENGELKE